MNLPLPLRLTLLASSAAALLALSACSTVDRASNRIAAVVTPYQVEVVQGNFISREQAATLNPGMSQQQVASILGSPLVQSLFHEARWDYVFTIRRKGLQQEPKRLSVFFQDGLLDRVASDDLPSEEEFVQTIDQQHKLGKIPKLQADAAQLQKALAEAARNKADDTQADLVPSRSSYPPLEP